MFLDDKDSLGLKKNKIYEPIETMLIPSLINKDSICLDIGAHIGYFTLLMAKHCKHVHSFEPENTNYQLLRKNIRNSGFNNITTWKVAALDTAGLEFLYLTDSNSGMHRIYKSKWCNSVEGIRTLRIDDFIYEANFIKIDVEGVEARVLLGMKHLIAKWHPIIMMEWHPPSIEEARLNPFGLYDWLKYIGYSIRLIPKISIPISFEELDKETRKEPSGRNVLCVKEGLNLF